MREFVRFPLRFSELILTFSCLLFLNQNLSGEVESSQAADSGSAQIKVDLAELAASRMKVRTISHGSRLIDEVVISGRPPLAYRATAVAVSESTSSSNAIVLTNVPAFNWTYGCSATSAGMMMGYYDNLGYSNMYAGLANGGVCPMNNETYWGNTTWPTIRCGECPFVASHMGIEGRAIFGHVDDYWIDYGSSTSDPYITGGWTPHTADCLGDFMGTNQSPFSNTDGSTMVYFGNNGTPLYDYTGCEPAHRDACHGLRLFVQSRGYTVIDNFSQYIYGYNGYTKGFTYDNFKAEIDAGRPVLIHVTNHTMLGYGYDGSSSTIYIHDTWDHNNHTMTWGGTYSGLQHYGVTVLRLAGTSPTVTAITPNSGLNSGSIAITSVVGTNFQPGAGVKLTLSGQADIVATGVVVNSTTSLSCTFDLSGAASGVWNVVLTNPNGEFGTLANGFTIGQSVYYVSPAGDDSNTGFSWSSAKKTIASALTVSMSGGQVWVASGTYSERITLKTGVALYGGFAGTETALSERNWNLNQTILDGQTGGSVVTSPSGATADTRIDGVTIRNGIGTLSNGSYLGGGIYCNSSSPTITNCTISGNTAKCGGGIYCYSCSPTLADNTINGNTASSYGGGIYCYSSSPTIASNTISGNSASTSGGVIYCYISSSKMVNNIIAFNSSGIYKVSSGTPVLHNNCVFNTTANYTGISAGTTDIQVDPLFVDRAGGDFHLTSSSPCINAGSDADILADWLDMDGQTRSYGSHVDIGADEWYPPIAGDANGDGMVDVGDLGILAANYGMTSGASWAKGDFNGDGAVDVGDLGILAANYGKGTVTGSDFEADYAKVFGAAGAEENDSAKAAATSDEGATEDSDEESVNSICSGLGLPLMAGMIFLGMLLVRSSSDDV